MLQNPDLTDHKLLLDTLSRRGALNRLGERETAAIIAHLVGNKELPADVMAEIVERTDGIPLFVEEMTKAVLEAEGEGESMRRSRSMILPTTVRWRRDLARTCG